MLSMSHDPKRVKVLLKKAANEVNDRLALAPDPRPTLYSVCVEVAQKWEVNPKSLHMKVSRQKEEKERMHGRNLLTVSQECRLVGFILAMERLGVPVPGSLV
mgnify:CR=1 FL=1